MKDEPLPPELLDQLPRKRWLLISDIAEFLEIDIRAARRLVNLAHFKTLRHTKRRVKVWRIHFIRYLEKNLRWKHLRKGKE